MYTLESVEFHFEYIAHKTPLLRAILHHPLRQVAYILIIFQSLHTYLDESYSLVMNSY